MNLVYRAKELVAEVEGAPAAVWKRMERHPRFWVWMQEYMTAKCLTDFWMHLRYGACYRQRHHYYKPVHGPEGVAGFLQHWEVERDGVKLPVQFKALIATREGRKTQLSLQRDAWEIARDPNTRLLIRAYTDKRAEELGRNLRSILDSTPYQKTYPHVRAARKGNGQAELWQPTALSVKRDIDVRTPTMTAAGMGQDVTGNHYEIGHSDDFEVEENANSAVKCAEMWEKFQEDAPLYVAGARRLFVGTPWGTMGIAHAAMHGRGLFKEMLYDLFMMPATVQVYDAEFMGVEPRLEGDRVTIHDGLAGFPQIGENLSLCQARVTFLHPATGDTVTELREVSENGGTWFRVNRPFPAMLGQPLQYVVGNRKPSMPHCFTLDSIDLAPPPELSDTMCGRTSLPEKKAQLGPIKFSSQYELDCVDEENLVLNPRLLNFIEPSQIPEGERRYFRAVDFATGSRTKASTAMVTGFWHRSGLYLVRIYHKNDADILEKALELFVGQCWVEEQGHTLKYTMFEEAQVEKSTRELLREYERNPEASFKALGGVYAEAAKYWFEDKGKIVLRQRSVTRSENKLLRISNQQPLWENGRLFVVKGCQHVDTLIEHAKLFRLNSPSQGYLDLLECIQELNEQEPKWAKEREVQGVNAFQDRIRMSRGRGGLSRALNNWGKFR